MQSKRKGQTTIFVTVGILILIIISIGVYYRTTLKDAILPQTNPTTFSDEEENVRNYVEECFQDGLQNAVFLTQKQSGHLYISGETFNLHGAEIPYAYTQNGSQVLNSESLESQFQQYLIQQLFQCTKPLNVTFEQPATTVTIDTEGVNARLIYPFTLSLAQSNIRNDYPYTYAIKVPLYSFLKITQSVADALVSQPQEFPLGLLVSQNIFKTETVILDNATLIQLTPLNATNETYIIAVENGDTQ